MSKSSGWIPIDKMLAQEFKEIRRPFSKIEAMFSYTLDVDNGRAGTVSGYSQVWGWSRCKVRNFLKGIQTEEGHIKDRRKTEVRQELDTYPDTTINPNPKEKPPSKVPFEGSKKGKKVYKTKKGKSLSGDRLLSFEKFWKVSVTNPARPR